MCDAVVRLRFEKVIVKQICSAALFSVIVAVPFPSGSPGPGTSFAPARTADGCVDPEQVPASHVSPGVQALPSLQLVPSVAGGFVHSPLVGSQVPATWHWSDAVQTTGVPVQVPPWQLSPVVQVFPSLQVVPFGAFGFEQVPVAGSQVRAT